MERGAKKPKDKKTTTTKKKDLILEENRRHGILPIYLCKFISKWERKSLLSEGAMIGSLLSM